MKRRLALSLAALCCWAALPRRWRRRGRRTQPVPAVWPLGRVAPGAEGRGGGDLDGRPVGRLLDGVRRPDVGGAEPVQRGLRSVELCPFRGPLGRVPPGGEGGNGMPYPDGINVSLNGAYLDFGGTAPGRVGCTMVPFRAFLEGWGRRLPLTGAASRRRWRTATAWSWSWGH